jgi:hypothetical protein
MIETGDDGRFRPEPFVVVDVPIEDLDGDFAVERFVDRQIDGTHTAPGEALQETVLTELLSDH